MCTILCCVLIADCGIGGNTCSDGDTLSGYCYWEETDVLVYDMGSVPGCSEL